MIDAHYHKERISFAIQPELPDHAVAWCAWMREQIKRVEVSGQAVHEVCGDMILPVTFGARRI